MPQRGRSNHHLLAVAAEGGPGLEIVFVLFVKQNERYSVVHVSDAEVSVAASSPNALRPRHPRVGTTFQTRRTSSRQLFFSSESAPQKNPKLKQASFWGLLCHVIVLSKVNIKFLFF